MSFTPTHVRPDPVLSFSLFPSNLRFLRKRRGLNQEDISALFNKKANTVGNWENGKTEPSIPELLVISGYFGVNLEDLLRAEMRQRQADLDQQLSLWPEPAERMIAAILPLTGAREPARATEATVPPEAAVDRSRQKEEDNNDNYNNEQIAGGKALVPLSAETAAPGLEPPLSGGAQSPASSPASGIMPGGDAIWFMLRELRSVQERLDRMQSAFDQSRPYRHADKSDH